MTTTTQFDRLNRLTGISFTPTASSVVGCIRLNQYSGRTVTGAVDIIGVARATATNVNVNNQMAYGRGEYYWKELSINNASAAQWQPVTNRAVQNGTTNLVTGNVFLPQTPESYGYDADGNLTNDGRWSYTWDAENRLLKMESQTSAPTGSKRRLTFAYESHFPGYTLPTHPASY